MTARFSIQSSSARRSAPCSRRGSCRRTSGSASRTSASRCACCACRRSRTRRSSRLRSASRPRTSCRCRSTRRCSTSRSCAAPPTRTAAVNRRGRSSRHAATWSRDSWSRPARRAATDRDRPLGIRPDPRPGRHRPDAGAPAMPMARSRRSPLHSRRCSTATWATWSISPWRGEHLHLRPRRPRSASARLPRPRRPPWADERPRPPVARPRRSRAPLEEVDGDPRRSRRLATRSSWGPRSWPTSCAFHSTSTPTRPGRPRSRASSFAAPGRRFRAWPSCSAEGIGVGFTTARPTALAHLDDATAARLTVSYGLALEQ